MRYSQFTRRIDGEGAAAWQLHWTALAAKRAGRDVILLSVGDPDFDTPAAITQSAIVSLQRGDTHYADILGLPEARAACARRHSEDTGQAVAAANVAITPGAQGGLFAAAMSILDPGDEALVPEPMYVTYEATLQASGAALVRLPCRADNDFRLDLRDLAAAITPRSKAIFLANPNNPTGVVMGRAQLEGIAALARRHDLWVVVDEVYQSLVFEGERCSIAALPGMGERCITLNSLSKSHAMTGWRFGWMVGPPELIAHVGHLGLCNLYGLPAFIQQAGITGLLTPWPEVAAMRAAYMRRRDLALDALRDVPGLRCRRPSAGMFMLLDVRASGLSARDFAWALFEETGVSVLDASAFGASAQGHLRLSFAIGEASLQEACRRIGVFARTRH
jgi:aspartate/methionine/tyrosine aminotransferase